MSVWDRLGRETYLEEAKPFPFWFYGKTGKSSKPRRLPSEVKETTIGMYRVVIERRGNSYSIKVYEMDFDGNDKLRMKSSGFDAAGADEEAERIKDILRSKGGD